MRRRGLFSAAGTVVALSAMVGANSTLLAADASVAGASARRPQTVTVGSNPIEIAIAPSRSEAYVLNDGSVSVVSLQTHRETAEIGTGWQDQSAIGVVRHGTRAYIGTFDEPIIKVFDTEKRALAGQLRVGFGATGIASARTSSGAYAYVSLLTAKRVAVVRTSDRTLVKRIKVPRGPQTVTTAPGGDTVWAGSSYSGKVWIIATARQKVVDSVNVPDTGPVSSIAFGPQGKRAWVAGAGGVSVVATGSGKLLAFVPTDRLFPGAPSVNPGEIALNRAGTAALVVNSTFPDAPGIGSVSVLDTSSLKVRRVISLGTEPEGLALDKLRGTTYVTNYLDDTVSWFDTPR